MAYVVYKEEAFPFNGEFEYIVKDKDGKDVTHTIAIKLSEGQLDKFDMSDKTAAEVMETNGTDQIAAAMMTAEQIKELKKNTKNDYQYKMIVGNISGHIMGFIQAQRIEGSLSAMNENKTLKKYQPYVSRAQNMQ